MLVGLFVFRRQCGVLGFLDRFLRKPSAAAAPPAPNLEGQMSATPERTPATEPALSEIVPISAAALPAREAQSADAPRPVWRQLLLELWNAILFLTVHQLESALRPLPDHREGALRPVVLVSGFVGASASWKAMRRALIDRGHPVYVADRGTSLASIWRQAAKLRAYIESRELKDCEVVCHSMGGLATLCTLEHLEGRIRRVTTLGTPFRGTWTAVLMFFIPSAFQLLPFSRFLGKAAGLLARLSDRIRAGRARHFDEVVIPSKSAQPPDCEPLRLPELGHCNLIMAAPAIRRVCEALDAPAAQAEEPERIAAHG